MAWPHIDVQKAFRRVLVFGVVLEIKLLIKIWASLS